MTLAFLFWLVCILVVAFGLWSRSKTAPELVRSHSWVLLFALIIILGWQVFGPVIHK
jgi:hypothetical protein